MLAQTTTRTTYMHILVIGPGAVGMTYGRVTDIAAFLQPHMQVNISKRLYHKQIRWEKLGRVIN